MQYLLAHEHQYTPVNGDVKPHQLIHLGTVQHVREICAIIQGNIQGYKVASFVYPKKEKRKANVILKYLITYKIRDMDIATKRQDIKLSKRQLKKIDSMNDKRVKRVSTNIDVTISIENITEESIMSLPCLICQRCKK